MLPHAPPPDRDTYRPSGRVDWPAFLPLAALTLVAAWVIALGLCRVDWDIYLRTWCVLPAIATIPVGLLVRVAVLYGGCRSRLIAVVLAAAGAAVVCPGFYAVSLAMREGWEGVEPAAVVVHFDDINVGLLLEGWLVVAVQFAVAVGVAIILTSRTAGRPFDERKGEWLPWVVVYIPASVGPALIRALEDRDADRCAELVGRVGQPTGSDRLLTVYYVPGEPTAYLTVGGPLWKLSEAEFDVVRPFVAPAADPPVPPPHAAGKVAVRIPAPAGDWVFDEPGKERLAYLSIAPLVGGAALIIGGLVAANVTDIEDRFITASCLTGGGLVAATLYIRPLSPMAVMCFALRRRCSRLIAGRADRWADPDDPATRFVGLLPIGHEAILRGDDAVDVGFLALHPDRRVLEFEGVIGWWRVPAGAVTDCRSVPRFGGRNGQVLSYMLCLRVRTADGETELTFAFRDRYHTTLGRERAEAAGLADRVNALAGR